MQKYKINAKWPNVFPKNFYLYLFYCYKSIVTPLRRKTAAFETDLKNIYKVAVHFNSLLFLFNEQMSVFLICSLCRTGRKTESENKGQAMRKCVCLGEKMLVFGCLFDVRTLCQMPEQNVSPSVIVFAADETGWTDRLHV